MLLQAIALGRTSSLFGKHNYLILTSRTYMIPRLYLLSTIDYYASYGRKFPQWRCSKR